MVEKIPWKRKWQPTPLFLGGFPSSTVVTNKNLKCNTVLQLRKKYASDRCMAHDAFIYEREFNFYKNNGPIFIIIMQGYG